MSSFAEVTTWERRSSGAVWDGEVPAAWMQGRASFGGVPAAVGLRAILELTGGGRPPRSVHVAFHGPLKSGPAQATAQVIREGRSVTHARAEIQQGDAICTQVTATLAEDRPSAIVVEPPTRPERPAPEQCRRMPHLPGVTPEFVQFLDMRWTDGALPFSGAPAPGLAGWCRHATDAGADPHVALLGLLDAWPSPVVPMLRGPAPASSVSWSTIFHDVPEVIEPDDFWWYRSEALAARHGYAIMRAELFGPKGGLAATVEQLVAIFDQPREASR